MPYARLSGRPAGVRIRCQGLVLGGYGGVVYVWATASAGPAFTRTGSFRRIEIPAYGCCKRAGRRGRCSARYPADRPNSRAAAWIGRYVAFEMVQFVDGELGSAWCDSDADSDRHLVDRTRRYVAGPHQPLRTFRNPSVAGGERLFRRDFGLVQQKLPVAGYRCAERRDGFTPFYTLYGFRW